MSRRSFLATAGVAAAAGLAAGGTAWAEGVGGGPATLGSGRWTYTLEGGWGTAPVGMQYEWGCAIVADSKDRIYMHSHANKTVVVFDREGTIHNDWGAEFAPSGHGLYHQKIGSDEFLYFSILNPYHQVIKTDLNGKVLLKLGQVAEESSTSIKFPLNMPTDVAVSPNGDIWVCEGYGGQHVHRFNAAGKFLQTVGGPGAGPGMFNTCHGIWIDTRAGKPEPEVYVADRNNHRLQVFGMDGKLKREVKEGIRQPCCFYQYQDVLIVPDLDKVVTVLDKQDNAVAQLGDGHALQGPAAFQAPHALTVDSHGDLYVIEWVPDARLRKFIHTPKA